MKVYDAAKIRNIAVVGHGGDGKTTLVESFLFDAGAIERKGRVEDGNTTTDFDPEEVKRGFSLTAGLAPVEWKGEKFNFIDTPGYFDFVGEATQAYALADSLLIVSNAAARLEVGAEKAFAVLLSAMEEEGKAAVAKTVLGTKETLIAIRAKDGQMLLNTLFFAEE